MSSTGSTPTAQSKNSAMSGTDTTGLAVVDAGVIVGHLDRSDRHHHAATRALSQLAATAERLMLPVTAFAECLVYPMAAGGGADKELEAALATIPIGVLNADSDTARRAARIRAEYSSLKLPDAFVIATAIVNDATALLTTDREWPKALIAQLPFEILTV